MMNKTFADYSLDDLVELKQCELVETDGGFLPLLIIGAALLLSSCSGDGNNVVVGGSHNNQTQINIIVSKGDTLIKKGDTLIVK